MKGLLDSSVLISALVPDEAHHVESLALLKQCGHAVYSHAFLETFSTLTGGRLGLGVDAGLVSRLLRETVRPRVDVIELETDELLSALLVARSYGARGGAVYDYMHLVAARKAGISALFTLNQSDFRQFRSEPELQILYP